jgi:Fic/DOC family
MRSALSMVGEPSDILRQLLEGNHSTVAGRLAGAFRNIGRDKIADTVLDTMRSAGHTVNEADPFEEQSTILFGNRELSPYVNRLRMMWDAFKVPIQEHFLPAPGKPEDIKAYLSQVDDIYASDAYHSLSIEGYKVSAELIERVCEGNWNPNSIKADQDHQNPLAARGYWQSFQSVKQTISSVLEGKDVGEAAEDDYSAWYRELFAPSVVAGIIGAADLAGYRNRPVYIRQSMHTPPSTEAVRDLIPAFFELLREEESPEVRVVLGHFIFVYIHPFMDGNGRTGRFLMNLMLAAGGYPWLVIPVERRNEYMDALESASVDQDIVPLTQFLADLLQDQL